MWFYSCLQLKTVCSLHAFPQVLLWCLLVSFASNPLLNLRQLLFAEKEISRHIFRTERVPQCLTVWLSVLVNEKHVQPSNVKIAAVPKVVHCH